ncbi:MAG: hypothetical protein II707_04030, partial [Spirochaetales bacterium]|nr:hypothetical protein [Spirochaetales bacterium]
MFAIGTEQDVEYPTLYVTTPKNSDCVAGCFRVAGFVLDDKEVFKVELHYEDNSGDEHILKQFTKRDFDFTLDLYASNVSSGDFAFRVTAFDTARHETTEEINLTIDKECPVFTLFRPNDSGTGIIAEPQIGKLVITGMVTDNYALNFFSPHSYIHIFPSADENNILYSTPILQTPFSFDTTIDTMADDFMPGSYTILMSSEDANGNIGTKRVTFTAAKGDTNTYIQVDSPTNGFAAVDTLTISGAAINAFVDVDYVQYIITKRMDALPINQTTATGSMNIGQAGSFSKIIPLKSMQNMVSGEYNLRLTAYAADGSSSSTAIVPFIFSSELAEYDFIDSATSPVGESPLISAYLNSDMTIDLAASSLSLSDMEFSIMQGGVYLQNWTSIMDRTSDIYDSIGTHYQRYTIPIDVNAVGLNNGAFTVSTRARRTSEGQWRTVSRPLYFDKKSPDIRITSHSESETTTGINGALTIQGACSDNMGLKSVRIKDDVSNTWMAVSGTPAIWSHIVAVDESESDITVEQKYGVAAGQTKNVTYTVEVSDYAGNIATKSVTVKIEPDADKPVLSFLSPSQTGESKVSGTFTMSATITDDDFPKRGLTAEMNIYKYNSSYTAADYASKAVSIKRKSWTIEPITGDLNLSDIIDTDADDYEDLTSYIIILTGSGWKNASANPTMARFYVDKTAPVIFIDDYDETNVVKKYCTDSIHFSGYVRYKANSELIADAPLVLQYTDTAKNVSSAEIALAAPTNITQSGISYKKRTFSVTINGDGTSAGFSANIPTLIWSDDEWGNSTKLFTFRATSTTAQQGVKTVRVYLDNHTPTVTIKSPSNGYLFDQEGTQSFNLIFSVDDEPPVGNSYSLNFRDNVQMQYKYSGASSWTTASSYGSGNENVSLKGDVTHQVSFNNVPDGLGHQLMIKVKDFAGNESAPQTLTFHKSTTPPAITTFKVNDSYRKTNGIYKGTVRIDIAAQDNHGESDDGLASVYVYLGDTASDNLVSANPKTFSGYKDYDTTSLEDGTYILSAKATDKTGITVTNSSCGLDN